jgi:hypothetical protein
LLTLHWLLTGISVAIGLIALAKARRATKRLERLTETYWELRYDHGQLRARVAKLDPEEAPARPESAQAPGSGSFVPLSSLKRG